MKNWAGMGLHVIPAVRRQKAGSWGQAGKLEQLEPVSTKFIEALLKEVGGEHLQASVGTSVQMHSCMCIYPHV